MLPDGGSPRLYDVSRIGREAPVLVCEGEIDALHAMCVGYNAVTSTGGANAWEDEWAAYIARMPSAQAHGVVVCYDGDDAGQTGAKKVAESLHAAGIDVRVADLPDGQDVNDVLLADGRERLQTIVDEAKPYTPPEPGTPPTDDPTDATEAEADDPDALVNPLRSDDSLTYCEAIPD